MNNTDWDVVVIGGGPSGMMAAGKAGEQGHRVLVLEKNKKLGEKLLITGGGRCNLTNAEPDLRTLLSKFGDAAKFLFSPFSEFNNQNTLDFFNTRGLATKVEALYRVFPLTNKALSVWETLVQYLKDNNVTVQHSSEVKGFLTSENLISGVELKDGTVIKAKSYILATGGMSRPETGSTGDGFKWLKALGHRVKEPSASLVPITTEDEWTHNLPGISLPEAKITLYQNDTKQETRRGKVLFTHVGLSGPAILNMSHTIDELLKYGDVELSLDLLPTHDYATLNTTLQELFKQEDKKKIKNALSLLIPSALVKAVMEKSHISPETPCHSITREERLILIKVLKDLRMKVSGLLGRDKAIITSGGVALEEIDFKTMASKLYPNLFIVGDLLDINRPSGGYSLQLCWTTGFVAGAQAAENK